MSEKRKRARIAIGHLVASTNPILYGCIKCLTIQHRYRPLNYKRVSRVVVN